MTGAGSRTLLVRAAALLFMLAAAATAVGQVRAVLQPDGERKPAPRLALKDSAGNTVNLASYRGKVVLLDFWATWCTGCKLEIPWFSEFQKTHGAKGFAAVGVSMDQGGWGVVRPFLAKTHIPYPILLGEAVTTKSFAIASLPDTFLIDRRGRIAAAYRSGIVDKNDIEANIKTLLSEP